MPGWIGLERLSLREVSRRLAAAGVPTSTGKARWGSTTIALMPRDTAHVGRAVFGRSRRVQAPPRPRPLRGPPQPARTPNSRVPVPREEWIEIPGPALVDPAVVEAARAQLDESRSRRRELRRRPGWLLQGLAVAGAGCCRGSWSASGAAMQSTGQHGARARGRSAASRRRP